MITIGLIKELYFIAKVTRQVFFTEILVEGANPLLHTLRMRINPEGELDVWYRSVHIWNEIVEGDESFFGVESCDSISRIVACIDNNDASWRDKYYYNQKNLVDTKTSAS